MVTTRIKPDIRMITRLVPPAGNLVQGQSELAISPALAAAASEEIAASRNHYSPAEGTVMLRKALAEKITLFNGVEVDPDAKPYELLVTHGGTGALVGIGHALLRGKSALVFEPYYPYHRRIFEELGGVTETFSLEKESLALDVQALRKECARLAARKEFPLRAIVVCTPVNPTGKVFSKEELLDIAQICQEFDLLCISDEVYEHYVTDAHPHFSMAAIDGMWDRTLTVNSFSKSWNISGWRLGYVYGSADLVNPLFNANNVFYVCSPTPLQNGLAKVLMADAEYYSRLRDAFIQKRDRAAETLTEAGFELFDSGSTFYVWAKIPRAYDDAMRLNEAMIKEAGVAAVPGSAFSDTDTWDSYMRICIARENSVLESALGRMKSFFEK